MRLRAGSWTIVRCIPRPEDSQTFRMGTPYSGRFLWTLLASQRRQTSQGLMNHRGQSLAQTERTYGTRHGWSGIVMLNAMDTGRKKGTWMTYQPNSLTNGTLDHFTFSKLRTSALFWYYGAWMIREPDDECYYAMNANMSKVQEGHKM